MFAVSRSRLQALSAGELDRYCNKLNDAWIEKGCPEPDRMPAWMLAMYVVLKAERARRGMQLRLF